jgi:hypothetical protein
MRIRSNIKNECKSYAARVLQCLCTRIMYYKHIGYVIVSLLNLRSCRMFAAQESLFIYLYSNKHANDYKRCEKVQKRK